ncbi:MAG: HDOD domain-containing protein [Planctomycetota bacterium]
MALGKGSGASVVDTASAHVARQPVFDRGFKVWGYELLDRYPREAGSEGPGDAGTARVLSASSDFGGMRRLTKGRPALVNFTRRMLVEQAYLMMPPGQVVVEVLEDVEIDDEVLLACKRVKEAGYRLAIDDVTSIDGYVDVLPLVDVLKVDWMLTDADQRKALCAAVSFWPELVLLAEKVETPAELFEAQKLGCTLYQGFFFQKPELVNGRAASAAAFSWARFMQEVNRPEVDFDQLEAVVRSDAVIAARLIRRINGASHGLSQRVTSIKQALVLLGEEPLRRWCSVAALGELASGKPSELAVSALSRAHFCEHLGLDVGLRERRLELFSLGLMSLLDGVLDQPMDEVLLELRPSADVRGALLGRDGVYRRVLEAAVACERGATAEAIEPLAEGLGVSADGLLRRYAEALCWSDETMGSG